jgi:hypothetical protein
MSRNLSLADTAVQACVVLSNAIDSFAESLELSGDLYSPEIRNDLCAAYAALCEALSRDLRVDAHVMIQQLIGAELEASRAMLFAQTGLRFPIEEKE